MALPSAGKKATATPDNPPSAQTDFSFIVDLSNMPSTWWADVNTTDGTRGRASKNDGTTELPCDWIDFNSTAETGLVRIKYTGTKSSIVDEPVIIYPPNTRNTAYGASDAYGQYNAYDDDVWGYWPLHDANDRTRNERDLTAQGGATFGGEPGLLGDATEFTGGGYADIANVEITANDWTITMLANFNNVAADHGLWGSTGNSPQFWMDLESTPRLAAYQNIVYGTTEITASTWYGCQVSYDQGGNVSLYTNGADKQTSIEGLSVTPIDLVLGRTSVKYNDGLQQHVVMSSVVRSDVWILYEYSQTSDNSTFWGTWTVSDVGGGGTTYDVTCADGITLSDSSLKTAIFGATCSDGILTADRDGATLDITALLQDGIILSDTSSTGAVIAALCADGVTLSDSVLSALYYMVSCNDGVILSDSCQRTVDYIGSLVDGIKLADFASLNGQIISVNCADGVMLSDSSFSQAIFNAHAVDGISLSDFILATAIFNASASDGIKLSDIAIESSQIAKGNIVIKATVQGIVVKGSPLSIMIKLGSIS